MNRMAAARLMNGSKVAVIGEIYGMAQATGPRQVIDMAFE
jgi:hypothetical protein